MKRKVLMINIVFFLAVLAGDLCYMEYGGLWLKGLTSFGFVLMGLVNCLLCRRQRRGGSDFPLVMVLGLTLCMLGDIVLNLSFVPGAALFALGHLFYFIAYCRLEGFRAGDLLPCALIFGGSLLILKCVPSLEFGSALFEWVCIAYALIISLMVGKAVANLFRRRSLLRALLVVGCVLFYFSDLMLVFDWFADAPTGDWCMLSYYPAQCLLAWSVCCEEA